MGAHYALVNRSFASEYLGGSAGIGRRLSVPSNAYWLPAQITSVVGDAREQGLNRAPLPAIDWCVDAPYPTPYFLLRTQAAPMALAETVRRKIRAIEPARSVYDLSPLEEHLSDSFAENRLRTILLAMFAATAVALACVGLYGTLGYFVTVRRREVGLRLALGAAPGQILGRFLLRGVTVALIGCGAGLVLAMAFARALSGMLYGVSTTDARTMAGVTALMVVVSAIASFLPAFRASIVEPTEVLRQE